MANVTMKDVADRAQVSVATVDRVLHSREGVSAKAQQRVKEAIHDLGFRQLPEQLSRAVRGRLRFLFLLPNIDTGFVRQMMDGISKARMVVPHVEVIVEYRRVSMTVGDEIIKALGEARSRKYSGVGLFAFDAPGVRAAIDELVDGGVPVVTLVSDVPSSQRSRFVGIDNTAAGRTAGRLMGKFLRGTSGEIGIITGNLHIRDHVERQMGFRQILGSDYRDLRLLPPQEGDSIAARNRAITIDLMRDHDRLSGIYGVGGGNSGILLALREMDPRTRPVVILHELTKDTLQALRDGVVDAVIAQDAGHMARSAIRQLVAAALKDDTIPEQDRIGIDIYLAENLP